MPRLYRRGWRSGRGGSVAAATRATAIVAAIAALVAPIVSVRPHMFAVPVVAHEVHRHTAGLVLAAVAAATRKAFMMSPIGD
jgi:hypothetical protein